jgi:uncharacterized repeat protein (TIGR02543 family)
MTAVLILAGCPGADDDDTKGNKAGGTFTVTFNADGGAPAPAAQTVNDGGKVTAPAAMTKNGYTFDAWYKEAAFTTQWNFASDTVTANITLYAKWTQNPAGTFTVTFNADGGTPTPADQAVADGGSVTAPAAMTKNGYTFDAWYKEAAFTTQWNFATDTVTADITLYAKWTQQPSGTLRYEVTTIAGSTSGYADGTGTEAMFRDLTACAVGADGNIYVADLSNHCIRKVTPEGVVTTLAGSGGTFGYADGTGTEARFYSPTGVAVDADGIIYVADQANNRIRKVTPEGVVTTFAGSTEGSADGTGTEAKFSHPRGVAVGADGNIYVADTFNHRICKVTPEGVVTTLAGGSGFGSVDGTGTAARFYQPSNVVEGADGNIYVANDSRVRKITPEGVVTTIAGSTSGYADGTGTEAKFYYNSECGVAVGADGNIYVADLQNRRIRKVTPEGVVTTIAGSTHGYADGTGTEAKFYSPRGIAVDADGNIYVGDTPRIRKITPVWE